jgi:hypothetical protein
MEQAINVNELHQLTDDNLDTVTGGVVVVPLAWVIYGIVAGGAAATTGAVIGTWIANKK